MQESTRPLLKFWLIGFLFVHLFILIFSGGYWHVLETFGDNGPYSTISTAFYNFDLSYMQGFYKHFWGLPFVMTIVRWLTGLNENIVIIGLSLFFSCWTIQRMNQIYGIKAAILFSFLSIDWIQRSMIGGAEPLFIFLTLTSFLVYEKRGENSNYYIYCALFGSLSCLIRPVGVFFLLAFGLDLLLRRKIKELLQALFISLFVGGIYLGVLYSLTGDPLAHFHTYGKADWDGASPISFPLTGLWRSYQQGNLPLLNTVKVGLWLILSFYTVFAMFLGRDLRIYFKKNRYQIFYFFFHLMFLLSYNSGKWSWNQFPRFVIPLLPMIALSLVPLLRYERVVYPLLYGGSLVLSAASSISIYTLLEKLRGIIS